MKNYFYIVLTLLLGMIIFLQMTHKERVGVPPGGIREIRHTIKDSRITDIQDVSPSDTIKFVYDDGRVLTVVNGEIYE